MISKNLRPYLLSGGLFVLGVIVTIIITKISDKVVPTDPVLVQQFTDTIRIVHDYNLPDKLDNDTIRRELETKLKNLELLNNYDIEIKKRLHCLDSGSNIIPNLIITHNMKSQFYKGYTQGSSNAYFSSDCPDLNSKYIDLKINFLNSSFVNEIACLRVNIYKFINDTKYQTEYISEDYYQVKPSNNFIRISNGLGQGKYEILYGFIFKNDMNKEYPVFYFKKCIVIKK